MTCRALRVAIATGAVVVVLATARAPAHAQWAVFDGSNFVQNVLNGAHQLQQIANEVTSLQNEAQMLLNQARTRRCRRSRARSARRSSSRSRRCAVSARRMTPSAWGLSRSMT